MNLIIANQTINQHNGLFSLNDLHKVSGGEKRHQPSNFLANQETKALIAEIESENQIAYHTVQGGNTKIVKQGTYVCKELVYRYAMWISAKFSLMVIRAFDKLTGGETIPVVKTTVDERIPLKNAVNLLVAKGSLNYSECYKLVHQYMGVNHIDEIPLDDLPKAVAYVHHLILQIDKSPLDDKSEYNAFWRMVGLHEYHRISDEIRELDDMLATISSRFHRLNKTKGLLFDSLSEQKINARADINKVQAFIHKQMTMKEKLNFFC